MLSIPGKVYALILLSRVNAQVEGQLHDCQCAFRKNRGLSDATFALRMLMSKCREYKQPLYMAFVDLKKAYDSIHRDALWRILRAYGVDDKLVELLMDLHTGTQAAVKLAGKLSGWFDIECGVRQGCVIAPLLFNVFFDCVVRQAMAEMPEGCGVHMSYHVNGELFEASPDAPASLHIISALLYADDMVLLSCNKAELEMMLRVMDDMCNKMGMCINASKTELMAMEPPFDGSCPLPEGVQLSGGTAKYVSVFKYLGGLVNTSATCEQEVNARIGKTWGRFSEMKKLWGIKRMSIHVKLKLYNAYVLPVLLFGSETWALTDKQLQQLERVHSSCLRQMLNVRVSDRHRLVDIRAMCGTVSLADYLTAARLRWFGHVMRMDEGRIPHVALHSTLHGVTKRPRGRPPMKWQTCVFKDLQQHELPTSTADLQGYCCMRGPWRSMVYGITHPDAVGSNHQRSHSSLQRHQQRVQQRQQQLMVDYDALVGVQRTVQIAGMGWLCNRCGRFHSPNLDCSQAAVPLRAISD